jgi:hypothetical protein
MAEKKKDSKTQTAKAATKTATQETPKEPEKQPVKRDHSIILSGIISAVAIIIIVFLLFGNSKPSAIENQLPQFPNSSATVPKQYANILSNTSPGSTARLDVLVQKHASHVNEFSVSYSGTISIQPVGSFGSITNINSPTYVNESQFGNSSKLSINLTGLPILGSGQVVYFNSTNVTLTCTNFNATALSDKNYEKILFGGHSITCDRANIIGNINFAQVAQFNLSLLEYDGYQLNYQKEYQSVYKGTNCTFISGTVVRPTATGYNGTGAFDICESDVYYIPLSFSLYFTTPQADISVNLNETSIGNSSKESYVNAIPGPVVG